MDLFTELTTAREYVAPTASDFGVPTIRSLIVCKRVAGGATEYFQVEPHPYIDSVNPRLLEIYQGVNSVRIELDDQRVEGVSKRYHRDQLVGRGISYLIDAVMKCGKPSGGFEADLVSGTTIEDNGSTWAFVVRRR